MESGTLYISHIETSHFYDNKSILLNRSSKKHITHDKYNTACVIR